MTACCDEDIKTQAFQASIALVGNPNCGKTTIFNGLTGAHQHIGNWPGVTVERKCGYFTQAAKTIQVVDLPGTYSLTLVSNKSAIDERIASEYILSERADFIVNIVDASNLERHLYLTTELLSMGVPMIVALNMMDVAETNGIRINVAKLSQALQCPVIPLSASKGSGLNELKQAIIGFQETRIERRPLPYPDLIQQGIAELAQQIAPAPKSEWLSVRLLENDIEAQHQVTPAIVKQAADCQTSIQQALGEETDILIAETRYRFIQDVLKQCITRGQKARASITAWIDRIVLNRFLGLPIFLLVMYFLFVFAINIGGAFQDFFDISSQTIFVDGLAQALNALGTPTWLTALLANGVGKGINTTVTFIPVIGAMFLFLAFLEDSGYMVRAAFVVDRFMQALGLPGKAFIPMIVGFGCNVPAIMAARTLENNRDRILTIMMSPFMSCGARLAIYAVFTAAFFPRGGQNVVFALYLIGILMAVFTGFILRRTVLKGELSTLVMELPPYHVPNLKTLCLHAWQRLKSFVFRAGKLIVPICVLMGALNTINLDGSLNTGEGDSHSLLSMIGQWVTPLFTPMGITSDNWPATVGLVMGVLAKEVVVGTLNTLYTQLGHFAPVAGDSFHFWASLTEACQSVWTNISQLGDALSNPILAKAPIHSMNQGVYGLMYQKFDGRIGAFAYLLFVLLYFPCVSTTAVMLRELHRGWSIFSIAWMTGVAYGVAVFFYQAATLLRHPLSSSLWMLGISSAFLLSIFLIRCFAQYSGKSHRLVTDLQRQGGSV